MKKQHLNETLKLFSIILILFLSSCDRKHAKELAGDYSCSYSAYTWNIDEGVTWDYSTNDTILKVVRIGKYLKILEEKIHIDSVWSGKSYYQPINADHGIRVQFADGKIWVNYSNGGRGGGYEATYVGHKIN
ncbi:MAG: hypothetical protein JXR58_12005 [Bacteroidales bacterium]|nr:hypothetical protein [Bacteroidales bacterium]